MTVKPIGNIVKRAFGLSFFTFMIMDKNIEMLDFHPTGCLSPLTIRRFDTRTAQDRSYQVPCGKCEYCVTKTSRDWAFRLSEELKTATIVFFFTLTYDDAHVPTSTDGRRQLCRSDLVSFLSDFCESYKQFNCHVRYFSIGEYGPKTLRPHYHGVLFFYPFGFPQVTKIRADPNVEIQFLLGLCDRVLLSCEQLWCKGFVSVTPITERRIGYVTKYLFKGPQGTEGLTPQFRYMSKKPGLGYAYLTSKTAAFHKGKEDLRVRVGKGRYKYLPRYYQKHLFENDPDALDRAREKTVALLKRQVYHGVPYEVFQGLEPAPFCEMVKDAQMIFVNSFHRKLSRKNKL